MKINWKKLLIDLAKVLLGAVAGASVSGCLFIPVL